MARFVNSSLMPSLSELASAIILSFGSLAHSLGQVIDNQSLTLFVFQGKIHGPYLATKLSFSNVLPTFGRLAKVRST